MRYQKVIIGLLFFACILGGLTYASSLPYEKQDLRQLIKQYVDTEYVVEHYSHIDFDYGGKPVSIAYSGVEGFIEFFIRKAAHAVTFATIAVTVYFLLARLSSVSVALPWSGCLTAVIAVLDEWHQSFTINRTALLSDVMLDMAAGYTALLIAFLLHITLRTEKPVRWSDVYRRRKKL
ncbi:VanZ family protein [Brevibacillus dissolubilis]|uniref:VanZ family protein n=1 Tax=Brevibacillus dissolubilis TaxID=1844116 RepID=UPI001117730F|nr:VanZ family protein [Brevibacillus dissolubilis]